MQLCLVELMVTNREGKRFQVKSKDQGEDKKKNGSQKNGTLT